MMFDNYSDVITVEEACEILNLGRNSMYRLLKNGEITAFQCGSTWKIPKASIEEFIIKKCSTGR